MKKICKQCGKEFELSESEISFYKSKGLELPKRCKSCRNKNKGQSNNNRNSSRVKQEQKLVSVAQSSQNNQQNHNREDSNRKDRNRENHNRNDKSYVVISAAAVLLVLLVFVLKSVFAAPSESILVGEDVVSSNIPIKQEMPEEALGEKTTETLEDAQGTRQQTEKEAKEQTQEQTDIRTQPETQTEALAETEIVAAITTIEAVPETQNAAYHFRKPEYLTEHFQKHGAEFPYATQEEYLIGANNVIQNPNALHKLEAEDGDDVYYVESTREFVVVSTDGYIRTYFLTDLDYYNRQ